MGAGRTIFVSIPLLFAVVSTVFSVLVLIGGLPSRGIDELYFLRINTTAVVPSSSTQFSGVINAVTHQLGLSQYYQTSLWNYCSGDIVDGDINSFAPISNCSATSTSYWFNPVAIIQDEIQAEVTVNVPQNVIDGLEIVRIAHTWLKPILMVGAIFSFLTIFACLFAYGSRLGSFFATLVAFVGALFTIVGAVLAQVLGTLLKRVLNDLNELNVPTTLSRRFYIFLWIAAGTSLLYWLFIMCTTCCCRPDSSGGRKRRNSRSRKEMSMYDDERL